MKIFISGDTPDGYVHSLIKRWGYESFNRLSNGYNSYSEGDIISNMKDADFAIFFISSKQKEKIGIRDHLTAYSLGVSSISIILNSDRNIGISENIYLLSDKILEEKNRIDLRNGLKEFIIKPPSKKERVSSSFKERY
ncbi:hypothetical protein A2V55_02155 [Candidatus Woesebacteria bacterium RBG_19FT_COMBO_37_29]|uniref:CD-NTase-associated protein 12/Pycsar effector protein TIR domain-containing protein n=1 Tax=Candidatus Woesebacteria bacterium RBG_19FT_COMBO_37_29 TaxID=1802486 RepID=A0A1F7XRN0_9BACT|nr:MAG: hypothetical protein A2V55_02155 [Candidatus Woesebacteria bacterium RBG_19FT_COMBO_37_29]